MSVAVSSEKLGQPKDASGLSQYFMTKKKKLHDTCRYFNPTVKESGVNEAFAIALDTAENV